MESVMWSGPRFLSLHTLLCSYLHLPSELSSMVPFAVGTGLTAAVGHTHCGIHYEDQESLSA